MRNRALLTIGTVVFVWGWGMTSYADEQQQAFQQRAKVWAWAQPNKLGYLLKEPAGAVDLLASKRPDAKPVSHSLASSSTIYAWGIILMGAGAGMAAYALWPLGATTFMKWGQPSIHANTADSPPRAVWPENTARSD